MNKPIIIGSAVLVAVIAFYGGTRYEKSTLTASMAASRGQFGQGLRTGQGGTRGGQFGQGGFAAGQIVSVTSTGITVQLTDGSSRVVLVPASASITKSVNGASADLVAGKYVTVTGTANSDGSVTASEIQLRNAPPSPRPSASPTAP